MEDSDQIWNRAVMRDGGESPGPGDRALSSLMNAHGLIMNGGVLHAVELLSAEDLSAAQQGYEYFRLPAVAELLSRSRKLFEENRDRGKLERELDGEYNRHIPSDSTLTTLFENHLRTHPDEFAPLGPDGH